MNITFNTYPWAFDTTGGGERQLLEYYSALKRGQRKWPNIRIKLFDMWNPKLSDVDLIHYFGCMPSSDDFLTHSKAVKGIPFVISPNFWPDPEGWAKSGVLERIKTILWLADLIIVNSYIEEEALVRLMRIDSSKIAIVSNAVDDLFLENISPELFRKEFGINSRFVLNVANIEPRKNQLAFLRALKNFPDLIVITVGGARDQWYVDACIAEGGAQLRMLPPIEAGAPLLRSAMAGCEFFAMPSLVETPSIASLEAAAVGAKVLTTELGSTKEYFKDLVTYVNPYDPESLIEGIRTVLTTNANPLLRQVIRDCFTWDKVVESLVQAYLVATGHKFSAQTSF
jgi:glycosyltransferase involved in cell wall biosynthesis